MADVVSILNTIRANASSDYQNRVPTVGVTNWVTAGNPITTYQAVANEFLGLLVNRIVMTMVNTKSFNNPLSILKGKEMPYGYSIQNIHVNPAKDETYSETSGNDLLKIAIPETPTEYFNVNRQGQYTATIKQQTLKQAFTNEGEFNKLIDGIFNSLYSGDNLDEFILMKKLFSDMYADGKIVTQYIANPCNSEANAKEFVKLCKVIGGNFAFPSSNYNKYKEVTGGTLEVVTWTEKEDLCLIITNDVLAQIDVEVLAKAFNMEKSQFLGRILTIDAFPNQPQMFACLFDESFVKVNDTEKCVTDFYNGKGLYWNYFLNHWQVYGGSLLANCVCFVDESLAPPVTP